jgi:hypothetical protein
MVVTVVMVVTVRMVVGVCHERDIATGRPVILSLALAFAGDRRADFVGRGKNQVRAIAHHAGADQGWRMLLRAIAARICFQAQITLPELMRISVRGRDDVGVLTIVLDSLLESQRAHGFDGQFWG